MAATWSAAQLGERASQLGWDAEFMRGTVRGSTRDKALAKAVEEMQPYFHQCNRCGQWVCGQVCWNDERGLCVTCAPKLSQEIAGMQAAAQIDQLNQKIQSQDWTQDINYRDQGTGMCPSCGQDSGGGSSARVAARRSPPRNRRRNSALNCGTALNGAKFCGECGTAAS